MRLFASLAGLLMFFMPPAVAAVPMTLAEAEALAIERDAVRAQLGEQADAQRDRAATAGALPDPEISLGVQNVPLGSFALDRDPMTQVMVGVEQRFPAGMSREFARERGRHLAEATSVQVFDRERQVRYALRQAWFAAQTASKLESLAQTVRADASTLTSAAKGRYVTGGGRQSDYLAAELRLDRLEERALLAREQNRQAQAVLRRWLGDEPGDLLPASLAEPPPPDILQARLARHPLLLSSDARIAAGEAGESVAEGGFRPNWKLGMSYGYRRGVDGMHGEPVDDMASVMVGFSLPLFTKNRQDRELSAARSETRAARHAREDILRELSGRLDAAWERHREASRQLELYEQRLLPASRRVVDATQEAYASNNAGFDELVNAHIEHYELQARHAELAERVQLARAEIQYLTGEPQ